MSLVMLYRGITLGEVSSTPPAMETITQFYNAVMKKGFFLSSACSPLSYKASHWSIFSKR